MAPLVVTNILEPSNQLERLNQYGKQQVIASNVTQILLITAPLPKPNFFAYRQISPNQ